MIIGIGLTLRATLFGSTAVSDPYEVAGFSPPLVFDFAEEFYRTGGSTTTFDAAMTHTRAGNATMVDSDGMLKWAPHNLAVQSSDISTTWTTTGLSAVSPTRVEQDASSGFHRMSLSVQLIVGATYTFETVASAAEENIIGLSLFDGSVFPARATFNLSSGVVAATNNGSAEIENIGNGEYLCRVFGVATGTSGTLYVSSGSVFTFAGASGDGIYTDKRRLYRSDLGGMVDNPDTGNSYVPTTSAARYLPRRGHHIYNGTSWVNEGVLVESEARTNLLLNSGTLATQNVTVTAVPHTLHFTGTGTVTLSGASTAGPLVGTGTGENNRVSLTFTPTAGTLTVTVTGTVTNADLEVGSTLSSHKPTSGSTVTRAADTITVPYANLPWPTPNVIGEELVTNGTFDTDSDWTKGTGWTISGGTASKSVGSSAYLSQTSSLPLGKVYAFTYTVSNRTTGAVTSRLENSVGKAVGNNGTITDYLTTTSSNPRIIISADSNFDGSIDNISVREIDPLSVSIQMDGTVTGNSYTPTRWYLDANNAILQDIGSTNFTFTQEAAGVVDTVTGGSFTSGINTPFDFASTHASTLLAAAVEGTALTDNTTPAALPALQSTDLSLAYSFMGTLKQVRIWPENITEAGREEATA